MNPTFDPIKFEVIRNALIEATEEMTIALRRSAYSTNIKPAPIFRAPSLTVNCSPLRSRSLSRCISARYLSPCHGLSGNMDRRTWGRAMRFFPTIPILAVFTSTISPLSHPYITTMSFLATSPIPAHHVDVGGGAPASIGAFREVFQEGVIISAVKMVEGGEIDSDVFRLVLAQIRSKHETAGDFRAQVASNNTGVRRLIALLDRIGPETVAFYIDQLLAYTERRTRAEIAKLPQGVFSADGYVDNDGYTDEPVRLVGKMVMDDHGVLFDLNGSEPQRRAPVNSTYAQTFSACAYVLKSLIDPDIPVNAGFYRLVRIDAPLGTVVNCTPPAPVVGGWETQVRLTDVLLKALAPAIPDRIPAGTKAMMCQMGFGGTSPRTDELYAYYETMAGGYGGRVASDGPDAVQCHGQNTENAPIEETEINYPVHIARYELVDDSDGAGKYRGGLGLRRDYLFDHEVSFTILADRDRWGPWGLFGGDDGEIARYTLNPDDEATKLGSKVTVQLKPGDVVRVESCGGGGYGPSAERDPQRVLRDVHEGKVSLERAREVYRVVIDPDTWTVDEVETEKLRSGQ